MSQDSDEGCLVMTPIDLIDHPEYEDVPLVQGVDWLMTEDPTTQDPQAWAVLILTGHYADWVVRYPFFEMLDDQRISFQYEVIHRPELVDGFTINEGDMANYMASILTGIYLSYSQEDSDGTTVGDYIDI